VTARSNEWDCGLSLAGTAGSIGSLSVVRFFVVG